MDIQDIQTEIQTPRQSGSPAGLASLHEAALLFASTHDLEGLLDLTMEQCFHAARAESGSIQLFEKASNVLSIVRGRGINYEKRRSSLDDTGEWVISKRVFKSGEPLLIGAGTELTGVDLELRRHEIGSAMSVPLKRMNEVVGVVNLNRSRNTEPFSETDLNAVGLLASQAGIAITNALLYRSLNYRLDELTLMCNFSESFVGLVDQTSVIRCLFDTVRKSFPIDFMGFLLAQKRGYEFLYWSRGGLNGPYVQDVCEKAADEYSRITSAKVNIKKIAYCFLDLKSGADDVTAYPFAFEQMFTVSWESMNFGCIVFGAGKGLVDPQEKITLLSGLVNQTRIALINTRFYNEVKENYIRTIKALAIAVDAKDKYTYSHSEDVQLYSQEIAVEMGMDDKQVGIVRDAGLLHDIGKIGIPGYILNKPGPLTPEEFNGIMKTHSLLGANILKDVPFLQELHTLVLHHHEHYDGNGYPDGLKGDEIPVGARIIHLADAFEAMTADRSYRKSLGIDEAVRRIKADSGKQFDPEVVEAFMRVAKKKKWVG